MSTMPGRTAHRAAAGRERAARLPPAVRKRQLVECAVRVFARHGFGHAGHAQVAREAGVSTPTVFLYLPNRQALVDAVLAEVGGYLLDMINAAMAGEKRAAAKLLAVARAYADTVDSEPDYIRLFLAWSTVVHEETWPQYVVFQDQVFALFESAIRAGIAAGELPVEVDPILGAHLVMGAAHMIAQMKFRGRSRDQIDAFSTALIRGALLGSP